MTFMSGRVLVAVEAVAVAEAENDDRTANDNNTNTCKQMNQTYVVDTRLCRSTSTFTSINLPDTTIATAITGQTALYLPGSEGDYEVIDRYSSLPPSTSFSSSASSSSSSSLSLSLSISLPPLPYTGDHL
jgi:hypothetical protein